MKALRWLVALCAVGLTGAALAAPQWQDYSPEAFAAARQQGKTVLVDIHAVWCPVCKVQGPILDELRGEAALAEVAFFKVDFDVEKEFLREHRIPRQSTVLIFKGNEEVGRSIAESDRARLRDFVLRAVSG